MNKSLKEYISQVKSKLYCYFVKNSQFSSIIQNLCINEYMLIVKIKIAIIIHNKSKIRNRYHLNYRII